MSTAAMHILLGVVGPALVVALVTVHFATRPAPVAARVPHRDRVERRRARSIRAHQRDLALGPPQLMPTLAALPAFDEELPDDAEPCDMAALIAEQDVEQYVEIGYRFVARLEQRIALETAVSFGFVYLDGAARPARIPVPQGVKQ